MLVQQVRFHEVDDSAMYGGLLIDERYIICACCGGVFDLDNDDVVIDEVYKYWIDFSDEIMGDYHMED